MVNFLSWGGFLSDFAPNNPDKGKYAWLGGSI